MNKRINRLIKTDGYLTMQDYIQLCKMEENG